MLGSTSKDGTDICVRVSWAPRYIFRYKISRIQNHRTCG